MISFRVNKLRVVIYRLTLFCGTFLFFVLSLGQVAIYAISQDSFNSIINGTPFYDPDANLADCSSGILPTTVPDWGSQIFTNAANQYDVPPALVATIYWREHGGAWEEPPPLYGTGLPYASSGVGPVWPDGVKGARGPFQFEYPTWLGYLNANPAHQINPNDNSAVIQSVEDLTDAAFGAAKKLADLGGKNGNPIGSISNTLQPNTIVNAIRAYNEGAAATDPDLSYVQPALEAYDSLTGDSSASCVTSTGSIANGVCLTTLSGSYSKLGSTWQPLCPWIPTGGYHDGEPFGQCTWWAAYNLSFHPNGNADQWYSNAVIDKSPTEPASSGPKVGEVVSYSDRGGYSGADTSDGHVAYIVAVAANGQSYTISEANFKGLGVVDTRTIPFPDPDINGFLGVDPAALSWLASNSGATQ